LYANIGTENEASKALFTKFGFECIGIKKDWNLVKGVYKDEAIFQLINQNFKILVLNIKKIIATLSIVVVSGLIIYGFISVQQILRTTLNLLKVRCMFMFLQMPIIQKSRNY
jgi:hypothetical protein